MATAVASIQARAGSYRVMWRDQEGRQRSLTFPTHAQARAYKAQVEHDLPRNLHVDPSKAKVPLNHFVSEWFDGLTLKPKTVYNYSLTWDKFPKAFGRREVGSITSHDCQKAIASMSHTYARQARAILRGAFALAVDTNHVHANPADGLRMPPKPKRVVNPFTVVQLRHLAAHMGFYEPLVLFMGLMGTRWGETAALTPSQFHNGAVTIDRAQVDVAGQLSVGPTKTGQVRSLPVPDVLLGMLTERGMLEADRPYVFTTKRGKVLRIGNYRYAYWKTAQQELGMQYRSIHHLRHTCASLLVQNGANPKAVQSWLGHSSITMTLDVYSHLFNGDLYDLRDRLNGMME